MAADGGCERDVVHRMNEEYKSLDALKSVRNSWRIADKYEEVSI